MKKFNIEKLIKDLKKESNKNNISILIENAINFNVINNTKDILKIVRGIPTLEDEILDIYDNYFIREQQKREIYFKKIITRINNLRLFINC